jgi:hypothetical protein
VPSRFDRTPFALPADECRDNAGAYEQTIAAALARPAPGVADLERLVRVGVDAAAWRSAVDPAAPSIAASLRAAAAGAAALFTLAALPAGGQAQLRFPDGDRLLTSTGFTDAADGLLWERGMFAAMASRSHEAVEVLSGVSTDLLRRSTTRTADWGYLRIEAFAAYGRRAPDALTRTTAASKATDATAAPASFKNFILDIAGPSLDLLYAVLTRDQAAFDSALDTALKGHKHYYSRGDGKRDILGQLALAPLALCVAARDAGLTVSIATDYLPTPVLTDG